jgi:Raf kinase inhibitor-like YbhB/YbcL family protein
MKQLVVFIIILVGIVWAVMFISKNRKPLSGIKNSLIMEITSSAFANNSIIPDTYTCTGDGVNPPLQFSGIPADARSLALILDDPDAPSGTFTHWVVYNMTPATTGIAQNSEPAGTVAQNSAGTDKYISPCPPSDEHRYFFKLYALDTVLPSDSVLNKADLVSAMNGHILDQAQLLGRFSKK